MKLLSFLTACSLLFGLFPPVLSVAAAPVPAAAAVSPSAEVFPAWMSRSLASQPVASAATELLPAWLNHPATADPAATFPAWFAAATMPAPQPVAVSAPLSVVRAAGLSVSGPATANVCDVLTYTVVFTNNSTPVTNVLVTSAMHAPYLPSLRMCGPYTMTANQVRTCTFVFTGGCAAVSGQNVVTLTQSGADPIVRYTDLVVNPGAIIVRKEPAVIAAYLDDLVTWTVSVENTGYGDVTNVVLTDVLGSGMVYQSGLTTTYISRMTVGEVRTFPVVARVEGCVDLTNMITGTWGCDGQSCLTPQTASAAIDLQMRNPNLDYTLPIFDMPFCAGSQTFTVPITNVGDGVAYSTTLTTDLSSSFTVIPAPGVMYSGGAFHLPPIAPGETYNLVFTLALPADVCSAPSSGNFNFDIVYYDRCQNPYYELPQRAGWQLTDVPGEISLSKTMPSQVYRGEQVNATITVNFTGITGDPVVVTDTLPPGWTVFDDGGGNVFTVGGTTYITWEVTASSTFNIGLNTPAATPDGCDTCGLSTANLVAAYGTDCQDCARTATAEAVVYVECDDGIVSDKQVSAPLAVCSDGTFTYTNTYSFGPTFMVTPTWGGLIFTESLAYSQTYANDTAQVWVSNGITSCDANFSVAIVDEQLIITDIAPICVIDLPGATLEIIYETTVDEPAACSDFSWFDWSYLNLGVEGNDDCAYDGLLEEGVFVETRAPQMTLRLDGLPPSISECGVYTVTLTAERTTPDVAAYDAVIDLMTDTFAVLTVLGFGGVTPVLTETNGSGYHWYYGDAFATALEATVRLRVQLRCTGDAPFEATLHYDNRCTDDDNTYRESCSAGGTLADPQVAPCSPIFTKFPEVIYATSDFINWTLTVFNAGAGPAYNVTLTDTLGSGLQYVGSTINSTQGSAAGVVPLTSPQHVTWTLPVVQPKEKVTILFDAEVISCDDLTNRLGGQQGCLGENCREGCAETAYVELPPTVLLNTNLFDSPLDTCSTRTITVTVRNAGMLSVYTTTVQETLPLGLNYVTGTTEVSTDTVHWQSGPEPDILDGQLSWSPANGAPLDVWMARIRPYETVYIRFQAIASCPFTGGQIRVQTSYFDPCGAPHDTLPSSYVMEATQPDLIFYKTGQNLDRYHPDPFLVYGEPDETVVWTITATNLTDAAPAPNVIISDTLPGNVIYQDATPGYNLNAPSVGTLGGMVTWTVGTLNPGQTVVLTVTTIISDPEGCTPIDTTNHAQLIWGCDDGCQVVLDDYADLRTRPVFDNINVTTDIAPDMLSQCGGVLTVTLFNDGPPAYNVILTDTLPAGFVYSETLYISDTLPLVEPLDGENLAVWMWDEVALPSGLTTIVFSVRNEKGSGDMCLLPAGANQIEIRYDDNRWNCLNTGPYIATASQTLNIIGPVLTIAKTPVDQTLDVGDPVEWTLTVQNTGTDVAYDVVVTDVVGTNYVNVAAGNGSDGAAPERVGNAITWTLLSPLAVGASWTATVTADLIAIGDNTNRAWVQGACDTGCVSSQAYAEAHTTLLQEFSKGPEIQTGTLGNLVTFYITATLPDQDALYTNVVLTDALPIGLGYVSAVLTYTYDQDVNDGVTVISGTPTLFPASNSTGPVVWNLGNLPGIVQINGVITAMIQYTTTNQGGVRLTNLISMTYTDDGFPYVYTDTADVDIVLPTVDKTAVPALRVGDVTTYNLIISIPAGVSALGGNTFLRDALLPGIWYITDTEVLTWSPPSVGPITFTNRVSYVTTDSFQIMYWYFSQPVTSEQDTPTVITLSFQVQVVGVSIYNGELVFTDTLDYRWPGNRVELWQEGYFIDDGYATSILIQPHLNIDKDSSPPPGSYVTSGDLITYTLTITNDGFGPAYDIIISDTLPAGLTYVSSAISSTSPPTITFVYAPPLNATGVLTWRVNELSGQCPYPYLYPWTIKTAVMTVVARVDDAITASLRLTNTAAIPYYDSQPGDGPGLYPPDEREYADGEDSVVHYTAEASIVKAAAPPTATIGSVITYTIRLPEPPITATLYTVTVTDQLSPWLELLTLAAPDSDTATWDTRAFTVTYATIPALAQRFITVTALVVSSAAAPPWEPVAGDVITNIVTLQHSNDVTTSNEVTIAVLEPRVVLDKRVETPRDPLGAGDLITYSIVFTNTGDWPAYDLVITDNLPAGLAYVGEVDFTVTDPAAALTGAYPEWMLSQLNVGGVATIRFTARVTDAITAGVTLTNAAWGAYDNWPGDNPGEREYDIPTDTVPVDVGNPALNLEKSAWPSLVEVDSLLAYTLTVANTGIVSATGVVVTDAVPLNTTYLSCGPLPCSESGGVVTWPLGVLDINVTRVLTMLVQVASVLPGGTVLTNTAWVTSTEGLTDTDQVTTPVNANAEIRVEKTGSPSPVTPGLPMTYSLTVTNDGPAAAENVVVTDTLPVEVSFVDAAPYPNVSAVNPLVWNLGTLADGESRTILITVTVNADVTAGFTNTVIITTTTPGDDPGNNEDNYPVGVLAVADLAITKSDNPDPVTPGAPLMYTLVYTNYGPSDAQNVVVTDTLPAGVTFVSATPSESSGPNPLVWNLGTVAAGASGQIVITVTVQSWVTQTFTNTVVIGTDTPESDYDNNDDDEPTDVMPVGDASIVKTATPPTATIGSEITFTIRLPEPPITATLYDVVVTDQLSPWLDWVMFDTPGGTYVWDWDTHWFTVTYPIILAGEQRVITVTARVVGSWEEPWEPVAGDLITNVATLSYGNVVTTSNEVTVTVVEPELVIIKASDPPQSSTVAPGQAVTYTVAVTNVGGSPAYGFNFWDELPLGMQTATPTLLGATIDGSVVDPGDYFLWSIPGYLAIYFDYSVLPVGSVLEINYVGYVDWDVAPGMDLTNTASIEWWSWFPQAEIGRRYPPISDTNTVHVGYPALDLVKSAWPNPVETGGLLTYTLTVSNPGVFPVTGVVVTDVIPLYTTFVAATLPHTGPAPDSNPGSVITWTLGDLDVGATRVLTMVVQVDDLLPDGTLLRNTAWVTSTEGLTDTDTVTTVVESWHSLAITKTADPSPVPAGGLLTYTLAWTVTGNEPALGVTISDTVPAHTVYQSCAGAPCAESGGIVIWDLGDQNPPASGNVTLVVLVDSPLLSGTVLYNAALITDTQGLTDTDDITTVVESWHSLAITKTADPDPVTAGELLTYTLAWAVDGTEPALGVTISDAVPDNTTYVSSDPLAAVAPPVGGTGPVIWSLGDVVPPASGSVILVVQVNSALSSGMVLTNAALISDTQGLTDTDQITTLVNADVEIWVLKTGSASPVTPGEAMTYSLTVTNDGPSAAENVLVTDTLPVEVTFVAATPAQDSGPNPLVWALGTLAAGENRTILITVTVNADVAAGFTNTVVVTTTTPGDDPGNNEDDYPVDVLAVADLAITKSDNPDPVTPGETLVYTLVYTNNGPSDAQNVVVTDPLPAAVTFVAANPSETSGPNPLVWNLGNLAAGASGQIVITVTVNSDVTEPFTNTVVIDSDTDDDNPGNNEDDEPTAPLVPGMELVKTVLPGAAVPNMPFTYVIAITNTGYVTLDPLVLTDTLPSLDFHYVAGSATPSEPDVNPPLLVWSNLGPLVPGASITVAFAVTVTPGITPDTYVNVALAAGEYPGGVLTDTDDVPISIQDPAIALSKHLVGFDTDIWMPNFVTFTIFITNVGISTIDVLPLYDIYDPFYLHFASAFPVTPDTVDNVAGEVAWFDLTAPAPHGFGRNLQPGEAFSLTTVFTVVNDITTPVTNTAVVSNAIDVYDNPTPEEDDDAVIVDIPTAVDLLYFRAVGLNDGIRLEWATAVEIDNFGFTLHRATGPDFTRASEIVFVPSACRGNLCGATYAYLDTVIDPDVVYWYWLADVDTSGVTTLHGPVSGRVVGAALPNRIFLPLVLRNR